MTRERVADASDPRLQEMAQNPPGWLQFWASQVGAQLTDGLRENPGYIAFAQENGTVYHTYTVTAPDPFVAPYFSFLLDRTPSRSPTSRSTTARTSTRPEVPPMAAETLRERSLATSAVTGQGSGPCPTR